MKRVLLVGLIGIAGIVVGGGATLLVQGSASPLPPSTVATTSAAPTPAAAPITSAVTVTSVAVLSDSTMAAPSTTLPDPAPPDSAEVLLVWTPGRLPTGFAADVAAIDGVEEVTVVRSDLAHLTGTVDHLGAVVDSPPDGFVVPVEVMAFDPTTYPAFVPAESASLFSTTVSSGSGGEGAILGRTSAELRRLGPGGILRLEDGTELTVTAVVDDEVIGGAEVAIAGDASLGDQVNRERYLLIRYRGARTDIEESVRAVLPPGVRARVRGPGETPVFRHGDAVLPQALVKERFGEFAYRPRSGLGFDIERGWWEESIVVAEVPILGSITCHRSIVPLVADAMADLEARDLAHLVDPDTYRGCYNPRYIAGGRGISRHAWGIALDLNFGTNPTGLASAQDPRLVATMESWGFGSGHQWLIPDPGHFEWVTDPGP